MPLVGVYLSAALENVASISFPDSAVWTFELSKARDSCMPAPHESVAVSKDMDGVVEWHGMKGQDRLCCDRRERQGVISIPRRRILDTVTATGRTLVHAEQRPLGVFDDSYGDQHLVAVFSCQGCEPVRAVSVGPVIIKTTTGESIDLDIFDLEFGWLDFCSGVACSIAITETSFGPVLSTSRAGYKQPVAEQAAAPLQVQRSSRRERRRGNAAHGLVQPRDRCVAAAGCKHLHRCGKSGKQYDARMGPALAPSFAVPMVATYFAAACYSNH